LELRHAGNTSGVGFAEEHSLRVLAVHLAKSWRKYHLSDIAGKVRTDELVTNDTTSHVYGKAMLVAASDSPMRIIKIL